LRARSAEAIWSFEGTLSADLARSTRRLPRVLSEALRQLVEGEIEGPPHHEPNCGVIELFAS